MLAASSSGGGGFGALFPDTLGVISPELGLPGGLGRGALPMVGLPSAMELGSMAGRYSASKAYNKGRSSNVDFMTNLSVVGSVPLTRVEAGDIEANIGINQLCFVLNDYTTQRLFPKRVEVLSLSAVNEFLFRNRAVFSDAKKILQKMHFLGVADVVKPMLEYDQKFSETMLASIVFGGRARCVNYWGKWPLGYCSAKYLFLVLRKRSVGQLLPTSRASETRKRTYDVLMTESAVAGSVNEYWQFEPDISDEPILPLSADYYIAIGRSHFIHNDRYSGYDQPLETFTHPCGTEDRHGKTGKLPFLDIMLV